ncbi:MAG: NAD(P)-dependent oxidoreductase [Xanthomonadales bacterium]|nr:NAD(P)-dependent oxidoreductase [Xanthomonadales bacterium]
MHLAFRQDHASSGWQAVLILGVGLIGSAVRNQLQQHRWRQQVLPFSWEDRALRETHTAKIVETLVSWIGEAESGRLDVVWSAGIGGLRSTEQDLRPELAAFKDVMTLLDHLIHRIPCSLPVFHLISSAGGLYTGMRFVGAQSPLNPVYPYGRLKLAEEDLARADLSGWVTRIYRPSTIYGYATESDRSGLVATLITNGIRQRVSRVFDPINTIRDFVYVDDVGHFIARAILDASPDPGTFLLANGKPSVIVEIVRTIEALLNRPLYVHFEPDAGSGVHNSYLDSAVPRDLRRTDLKTGLRLTHQKILRDLETTH